jgi:AbrB family looped-hinge helix DNA binding protein
MDFPRDTEDFGCIPVSGQGQLTIPKAAREALGLDAGDRVYLFASASERRAWIVVSGRSGREIASFVAGTT